MLTNGRGGRWRMGLLLVAALMLGVGLAVVPTGSASQGDCNNDNSGLHNGYTCPSTTTADSTISTSATGNSVPNPTPPGSGDCKNDNGGVHNGYTCSGDPGGGTTPPGGGDCKNDNGGVHNGYTCPGDGGNPGGDPGGTPAGNPSGTPGGGGGGGNPSVVTTTDVPVTTTAASTVTAQQGVLGEKIRVCASRRTFTIHVRRPHGTRLASAVVTLHGRRIATRKGSRISVPIKLKGLPRGVWTVKIRAVTVKGKVLHGQRTYHTCVPKKKSSRAPKL